MVTFSTKQIQEEALVRASYGPEDLVKSWTS